MGSHSKKHRKTRRQSRSRSRSRGSDHRRRKSGRRSRSRSVSSNGSSYSHKRSKPVKPRRRSRSRSTADSSTSRSRSPFERHRNRRSRSRSTGRSRRGQRSHSTTRNRRSRSCSRTPRRHTRRRSRSRSASHSGRGSRQDSVDKVKTKDVDTHKVSAETVKQKMQKALEAAATANEKIKGKGIISTNIKSEPFSLSDEREKQLTISHIEEDSFKQSTFLSSHAVAGTKPPKLSKEQNHDNAIFGGVGVNLSGPAYKKKQMIFYKTVNRGELASSLMAKSSEEKMQAWVEKLQRMRRDKIAANPEYFKKLLTIGTDSRDRP